MNPAPSPPEPHAATRVILLSTAGGAITSPVLHGRAQEARHGISSLLEMDGALYLIDFGMEAARQATLALAPDTPPNQTFERLAAGFITHLHSNHTLDLADVLLSGYLQGWPPGDPVPISGPGPKRSESGADTDTAPASEGQDIRVLQAAPIPGTEEFVAELGHAFAADLHDRAHSSHKRSFSQIVRGVDLDLALGPESPMESVAVYEDDRVQAVDHGEMCPALAYRFDSEAETVVFSGDTCPSQNLVRLARGVDILVHEAIDASIGQSLFG